MRCWYILLLTLFIYGCAPDFVEQQSETLSQGVYGVSLAIQQGRIDKAAGLSNALKVFVNAPKLALKIDSVVDPVTHLDDVILPAGLNGKVVVVNSAEYQDLLLNKQINKQLTQDNKDLKNYQTTAEKQQVKDQEVLNSVLKELNDYKASIFFKMYKWYEAITWFSFGFVIIAIIAVIVICVFFPPLVGPMLMILGKIFGVIYSAIKSVLNSISSLIKS